MMTVKEIMSTNVGKLGPDASLDDARALMAEKNIRHVPIIDEVGQLKGLVTQRDVLAATLSMPGPQEELKYKALKTIDIMRTKLYKVEEDSDLRAAALLMQRHKIGSLLVVNEDQLVGIITDSDYVGLAINLLEQMEEVEPLDDDLF